jgi:hypothetical protein
MALGFARDDSFHEGRTRPLSILLRGLTIFLIKGREGDLSSLFRSPFAY